MLFVSEKVFYLKAREYLPSATDDKAREYLPSATDDLKAGEYLPSATDDKVYYLEAREYLPSATDDKLRSTSSAFSSNPPFQHPWFCSSILQI